MKTRPVAASVTSILAPGTTAPLGSVTVPEIEPVLDWANALLQAYPNRRAIVTSHYILNTGNPASFSHQEWRVLPGFFPLSRIVPRLQIVDPLAELVHLSPRHRIFRRTYDCSQQRHVSATVQCFERI